MSKYEKVCGFNKEDELNRLHNNNSYLSNKEKARQKAIDWQNDFSTKNYSYSELSFWGDYFYKLGKRYGLLKEFKENGIC